MRARGAVGERRPAVAGTFYPSDPGELAAAVDALLASARPPEGLGEPVALIVPHAGYAYSGPVAATGYALLREARVTRVALFGPAHFAPLRGAAVSTTRAWRTPLGPVPLDEELRELLVAAGAVADEVPHLPEHSLEVQVPFLQRLLGEGLRICPVLVGVSRPTQTAELMAAALPHALVVVSTDLSHYHDDATAKRLDRRTAETVLARDAEGIGLEDACGVFALRGIVELARREDLQVHLLDLRTSADTAGDPWRVVGYGAFALTRA
jgi:AmmeMemoRadiSam system protein B